MGRKKGTQTQSYTIEVKLAAVKEYLEDEVSYRELAKKLGMPSKMMQRMQQVL